MEPAGCVPVALHVARMCPHLKLAGLMTIGQPDYTSRPEDFSTLAKCRFVFLRQKNPLSLSWPHRHQQNLNMQANNQLL